ncbi:hypothetical protein G7046_g7077 [Stylonectria norvegica]|nr:hypothetical protein G7046_g7077 [Stylonectria norvegica]
MSREEPRREIASAPTPDDDSREEPRRDIATAPTPDDDSREEPRREIAPAPTPDNASTCDEEAEEEASKEDGPTVTSQDVQEADEEASKKDGPTVTSQDVQEADEEVSKKDSPIVTSQDVQLPSNSKRSHEDDGDTHLQPDKQRCPTMTTNQSTLQSTIRNGQSMGGRLESHDEEAVKEASNQDGPTVTSQDVQLPSNSKRSHEDDGETHLQLDKRRCSTMTTNQSTLGNGQNMVGRPESHDGRDEPSSNTHGTSSVRHNNLSSRQTSYGPTNMRENPPDPAGERTKPVANPATRASRWDLGDSRMLPPQAPSSVAHVSHNQMPAQPPMQNLDTPQWVGLGGQLQHPFRDGAPYSYSAVPLHEAASSAQHQTQNPYASQRTGGQMQRPSHNNPPHSYDAAPLHEVASSAQHQTQTPYTFQRIGGQMQHPSHGNIHYRYDAIPPQQPASSTNFVGHNRGPSWPPPQSPSTTPSVVSQIQGHVHSNPPEGYRIPVDPRLPYQPTHESRTPFPDVPERTPGQRQLNSEFHGQDMYVSSRQYSSAVEARQAYSGRQTLEELVARAREYRLLSNYPLLPEQQQGPQHQDAHSTARAYNGAFGDPYVHPRRQSDVTQSAPEAQGGSMYAGNHSHEERNGLSSSRGYNSTAGFPPAPGRRET